MIPLLAYKYFILCLPLSLTVSLSNLCPDFWRGVGYGQKISSSPLVGGLGQNDDFWCILGAIFHSSAACSRKNEKLTKALNKCTLLYLYTSTLHQAYFYILLYVYF